MAMVHNMQPDKQGDPFPIPQRQKYITVADTLTTNTI